MPERNYNGEGYRYGFNGKESDNDGLGGGGSTYDYGFRIYNSTISRFLSHDPLSSSYTWLSPYQFSGNMPIWAIDRDGLEPMTWEMIEAALWNCFNETSGEPIPTNPHNQEANMEWLKKTSKDITKEVVTDIALILPLDEIIAVPVEIAWESCFTVKTVEVLGPVSKITTEECTIVKTLEVEESATCKATISTTSSSNPIVTSNGSTTITTKTASENLNELLYPKPIKSNPFNIDLSIIKNSTTKTVVNYEGKSVPVFRGGKTFKVRPSDVDINPFSGKVTTTKGVSVNVDASKVMSFGGAYKIEYLPEGLQIIQRGKPGHFEIIPTKDMSIEEFQSLLNQIKTTPVN